MKKQCDKLKEAIISFWHDECLFDSSEDDYERLKSLDTENEISILFTYIYKSDVWFVEEEKDEWFTFELYVCKSPMSLIRYVNGEKFVKYYTTMNDLIDAVNNLTEADMLSVWNELDRNKILNMEGSR